VCVVGKRWLVRPRRLGKGGLLGAGVRALWRRRDALGLSSGGLRGRRLGSADRGLDAACRFRSGRARVCPIFWGRRRVMRCGEWGFGEEGMIEGGR